MKEHPILFTGPMVRAILEGRKTQTRRVIVPAGHNIHRTPGGGPGTGGEGVTFPMYFHRDGDWWYLGCGRLEIAYMPWPLDRYHLEGGEAPGLWTYRYGPISFHWRRRWTVWKDHPYRSKNIRRYDQFGTFAAADRAQAQTLGMTSGSACSSAAHTRRRSTFVLCHALSFVSESRKRHDPRHEGREGAD